MELVDPKEFAFAVVSGNPCQGDTPEEVAENALKLYNAARLVAEQKIADKKSEDIQAYLL